MEIDRLREEIDKIDDAIAELLGRRLEIAKRIAAIKNDKNIPITDVNRESEVLLKWRIRLAKYGVSSDLASLLAQDIMRISRAVQIKSVSNNASKNRSICIVGYGAMAKTLAQAFSNSGCSVTITGRNIEKATSLGKELGVDAKPIPQAMENCDFVLLALSINAFSNGYVNSIANYMRGKIVMDILSTKLYIFKHMVEQSKNIGFKYVSTHPLFGPYTSPVGEKVVLIPSETGLDILSDVIELWTSIGVEPVIASIEEHEKAMAIVQVLTHFVLLAYGQAVVKLSKELSVDVSKFATPTYRDVYSVLMRLGKIRSTVDEIQKMNPFAKMVRDSFLIIANEIEKSLG